MWRTSRDQTCPRTKLFQAVSANIAHSLRQTNAEKQKAVRTLQEDWK
jgi:hypothetical protein